MTAIISRAESGIGIDCLVPPRFRPLWLPVVCVRQSEGMARRVVKLGAGSHKPSRAELEAIRKGEREIARGEFAALGDVLNDLDRHRLKAGAKRTRKA